MKPTTFLLFLLVAINLLVGYTKAKGPQSDVIVGLTFNIELKNNSILVFDTNSATILDKAQWGPEVFHYVDSAIDPFQREIYLLSDHEIVVANADSPFEVKRHFYIGGQPTDIQYDYLRKTLYGVAQDTHNQIVEIDPNSGKITVLTTFDDTYGVFVGHTYYDVISQQYFISVSSFKNEHYVMQFDLKSAEKKLVQSIPVHDLFQNPALNTKTNRLIGFVNDTIGELDLKSHKFVEVCKPAKGLPELYGYTFDPISNHYYTFQQYFTEKYYDKYDMTKGELVFSQPIFDYMHFVHFLPKK